jgi:hypothetical protein
MIRRSKYPQDSQHFRLTDSGRQLVETGRMDDLRPDLALYVLIMSEIGGEGYDRNIDYMTDQLIAEFGTAKAAIEAIEEGKVRFKPTD